MLVALTWTGNLPFGHASDATFHLWTLATEEQFYLFWPAVLALAFARGRVGAALVAVAAACLLACVATLCGWRRRPTWPTRCRPRGRSASSSARPPGCTGTGCACRRTPSAAALAGSRC